MMLLVITLAGLALRVWPVSRRSLWHDEVMTWRFTVNASWWEILTWQQHYEHPPLSFFLVKAAIAAFGSETEWVLRLPSLVCGVLAIPAAYLLGVMLKGRWFGVAIAALVAFDFNQVIQSQQARMYTLTVLGVLLTLCALVRALQRSTAWRWFLVGTGLAAAFAASNLGLILWAAMPLGMVLSALFAKASRAVLGPGLLRSSKADVDAACRSGAEDDPAHDDPRWRRLFAGLLVAYAAAIAWCSVGFVVMLGRLDWFRDKSGATPLGERVAGLFSDIGHAYASLPIALLVFVAGIFGVLLFVRRRPTIAFVLLALVATNLLFALPVQPHGFEPRPRYVILMQVSLWIGLASLLFAAHRPFVRAAVLAAFVGLCAWTASRSLAHGEQWRYRFGDAIVLVAPRVQPGDAVVFYPAWIDDLPTYYGMEPTHNPPAWGGETWRRERLLPFDALPDDRATWLVIAYHHETGATDAAPDMIAAVAERYGVTIDRDTARDMLVRQPVVIARIDGRGVTYVDLDAALAP